MLGAVVHRSLNQDYGPSFWSKAELLAVNDAIVAAERRAAAAAVHAVTTNRHDNMQRARLFNLHLQQAQLVSHPDGSYECARCGDLFDKAGQNAKSRARNKRRASLHAYVQCKSRCFQ